jgi:hypothetical protein
VQEKSSPSNPRMSDVVIETTSKEKSGPRRKANTAAPAQTPARNPSKGSTAAFVRARQRCIRPHKPALYLQNNAPVYGELTIVGA